MAKGKAFLFYFDDWFNSDAVKEMDGDEECGYLRLLCYAWRQPDCGLPNNEKILAQHSDLGEQWFLPTRDDAYRYDPDLTSGQKILKNFVEVGGRLYNKRLLKEREYQEKIRKTRSKAGSQGATARWGYKDPIEEGEGDKSEEDTPKTATDQTLITNEMANVMANAITNECKLSLEFNVSKDLSSSGPKSEIIYPPNSEGWNELCEAAAEACLYFDPSPQSALCSQHWCKRSMEVKLADICGIRERTACGQYGPDADPRYMPTLESFIRNDKRLQPCRPRPDPKARRSNEAIDYLEKLAFGEKGEQAA